MSPSARHLTPANVLATLALFASLGGVSYAAIKLPAASVGTRELRSSAVTGAKTKDRTLLAKDLKTGQVPPGPKGAAGAPGSTLTAFGVPAGGALNGTFPTPALAPAAATGSAVADNSLTGADIDESTLTVDRGTTLRTGKLATKSAISLWDGPSIGSGTLECNSFGQLVFSTSAGSSSLVAYRRLAVERVGNPVVVEQASSRGYGLGGQLRFRSFGLDGADPVRTVITNLDDCNYVAETQVG